jgi:zinc protease
MTTIRRLIPATALAVATLGCATTPPDATPPDATPPDAPAPDAAAETAQETSAPTAAAPTPVVEDPAVESDPSLTTGTLDNGLAYVVLRHGNPAGRMGLWLHVASGSLNESDEQRGLAHFLEHMAFNGSENFPPGAVVPFFQALGLRFGNDQNAFTNYDQTTYQLYLPNARPETLDKALLFFSDVASRLSLLPKEIDDERQIILEEKRARGGAQTRVREYLGERIAPESTFGKRNPIGVEEQIRKFTEADFRDYYGRWYVPSNMTLIAVGDAEPDAVVASIRKNFDGAKKAPRPAPRPVGVEPTQGRRAIVAADAELTGCDVAFVRCAPPRAPTTKTSQLRRELVEALAVRAYERRSQRLTATGGASFLESDCGIRDLLGAMTQYRVHARCAARNWAKQLGDLGVAVQRARLHGFSDREIDDARAATLAESEEAADRAASVPARQVLTRMNAEVTAQEPILSAAQRRDAMRLLLPGITAAEVSAAFADAFDPTNVVFTIEIASGSSPPTEAEFLKTASAAFDVKPDAAADVDAAAVVLADPPVKGTVAESDEHAASGVYSAWLGNGVRVHHRRMKEEANEATVTITLAAGSILETAADRGIAEAAGQAWAQPAGGAYTNSQIRDFLVGKKVHLRAAGGEDTMNLVVSGDPADLEDGMRLAHLLLTEPVVENRTLGGWRRRVRQTIAARKVQPAGVLGETVDEAFYDKSEVRKRPIETSQLDKIKLPAAQAWLRDAATKRPIEVAVVGDISKDAAMALVTKYLGALPARPRIGASTLADLRAIARPKGPIEVERAFDVQTPEAFVYDGFFSADASEIDDVRRLEIASRVLTSRMIAEIREKRQLVYSVRATSRPGVVWPGFGVFAVQAPTDPAKGAALAAALEEMFAAFAKEGPTDEETDVAKRQMASQLDEEMNSPAYWTGLLGTLDYRGRTLDEALGAPAAYQKITSSEVREAFAKRFTPESRFHFVVTPTGKAPAPTAAAPKDDGDK